MNNVNYFWIMKEKTFGSTELERKSQMLKFIGFILYYAVRNCIRIIFGGFDPNFMVIYKRTKNPKAKYEGGFKNFRIESVT